MKKMFMAVIALMMTISASAQFYIYCSDGNVIKVDSISMTVPTELENPTDNPSTPSQGIGVFSVSATKQVTFSKGNLQYHSANNKWRFAPNQITRIGTNNSNISSSNYDGWLDLFGWSTSANNFGVNTSSWSDDYSGDFVDWGTNKIGTDVPNTWRTLTYDEWNYLRWQRPNFSSLIGVACIDGINGLVFLPDNWTCPSGVTFKPGFHSNDSDEAYRQYQTFSYEQWAKLEAAGAVFLPAAGQRAATKIEVVDERGYYWSATEDTSNTAFLILFSSNTATLFSPHRFRGNSVRLVRDL